MDVIHRHVRSLDVGRGHLWALVPGEGDLVSCFFASGFPQQAITNNDGFAVEELRSIGSGVQVIGRAKRDDDRRILPLAGARQTAPETQAEPDLFRGLRAALTQRMAEDDRALHDWLSWHVHHHGRLSGRPRRDPRQGDGLCRPTGLLLHGSRRKGAVVRPSTLPQWKTPHP